jgi:outer membrane protein OmpA-like peptidoglycan-associated protein
MRSVGKAWSLALALVLFGQRAGAQVDPNVAPTSVARDFEAPAPSDDPYFLRYRPTHLSFEAGLYGGVAWFSGDHNLQDREKVTSNAQHETFDPSGAVGLRLAFFPLSFLGGEVEGGAVPTHTQPSGASASIWQVRGHGILQLPLARLVPFVLGGGGMWALRSDALGNDNDPVAHFGGGLKFALSHLLTLRVDVRDNLIQKNRLLAGVTNGELVHNGEVLLGLTLASGRTPWAPKPPPPIDSDLDGIPNGQDLCPTEPGIGPEGCPPRDWDNDKIPDNVDRCPHEAEDGAPPDPRDGCPNKDQDNDGILTPIDVCPQEPGIEPDGCPLRDSDGDGLYDRDDKCPNEPETRNGFQDEDGCPDELPKEVLRFSGIIQGIVFDTNTARIRHASYPLLNDAAAVLEKYPNLQLRITGHTDSTGSASRNAELSLARADAVKAYLLGKGVDGKRIETVGAGPNEPIADNKTAAGRAKNRRIEFAVLPPEPTKKPAKADKNEKSDAPPPPPKP